MERKSGPTALVFSRQNLPILDSSIYNNTSGVRYGGYVLWEAESPPDIILIGTGSEVHIALEAGRLLQERGIAARVVSLPSWELFDSQSIEYRNSVLPPDMHARISIEAGVTFGWERYVGADGIIVGLNRFGASAPAKVIFEKMGLTSQHLVDNALQLLQRT